MALNKKTKPGEKFKKQVDAFINDFDAVEVGGYRLFCDVNDSTDELPVEGMIPFIVAVAGLVIAGFDGIEMSRYLDPTLTTYVQNTERLGNEMADKLIAHIEYPEKTVVDVRTISGYVFHGDSLKPI